MNFDRLKQILKDIIILKDNLIFREVKPTFSMVVVN